jgi:glycosyltransferase involved in cell wall biosynthesis
MRLLSIIVCVSWVLAFGRTLLNLALLRRLRAAEGVDPAFVSVIIPARDEERVIERTVRALLAQTHPHLEIIVVNDRSADRTGEILRSIDDPRLVAIDGAEPPEGWLGKPWALHQGSLHARGELLLFADADIVYAPGAIAAAVAYLRRSGAAMICLLPHFEMHGLAENAAMPMLAMTLFTFIPTWLANRTSIGVLAVGGGPGNLVARDAYDAAGGHEPLKDAVVDDVALARLVRRRTRRRTEGVRADDFVSLRMYEGLGEIVRGFTKNAFAIFGRSYLLAVVVAVLAVIFHILPYILALTGDRWAMATVAVITLIRLILFRSLGYSLLSALFLHPVMVGLWDFIFLRSAWYTGVRRQLLWRGRTYDARATRFGADR